MANFEGKWDPGERPAEFAIAVYRVTAFVVEKGGRQVAWGDIVDAVATALAYHGWTLDADETEFRPIVGAAFAIACAARSAMDGLVTTLATLPHLPPVDLGPELDQVLWVAVTTAVHDSVVKLGRALLDAGWQGEPPQ